MVFISWIRCWYAAILLAASISAFSPAISWPNIKSKSSSSLFAASSDENANENIAVGPATRGDDIDSQVRRQLLFSLVAAVSASAIPFAADATSATSNNMESASSSQEQEEAVNLIKPPLDQREYETYELPNGLKVLLCSDPTSTSAAVGMNVHVGACSDPVEISGLAHFCEHMLFLGTEKYPEEDSFSKFLSSNGGYNNAFTDSEKTVYYFEMDAIDKRFSEALLRFGSFFSGPLFTESATGRELNAIESENAKNLQNDIFRLYQIEKDRVNSDHPYSKFFTGNKKTLLDDTKRQGINLRSELVKFYETYYSSNQMSLAVVAPQSLSVLKKFVSDAFGDIPNRKRSPPEDKWAFNVQPYQSGKSKIPAEKSIVEIVPIQDLRQVTLTWPIVFSSKEERSVYRVNKPDYFIASLLGHEGAGSILSYLKEKRWANSLGASDNADLSDFLTFEVTVELTPKGLNAIDDVCEAIFSYIQMMKTSPIPNYVFDENLQLDELEWRFLTKGQPSNYVQSLVTAMDKFPPSLYIAGPRRVALQETSTTLISSNQPRTAFKSNEQRDILKASCADLLSRLTVENSFLTVFSKTFEGQTTQNEFWYGTAYNVKPVSMTALMRWKNPGSFPLFYPRENIFIPSEKGLKVNKKPKKVDQKALTFEEKIKPISPPTIIRDDGEEGRWTVHYKEDDRFGKPKAFLIFQLLTEELYSSPTKAVLGMLYQQCAGDKLNEETYDARLAGLTYDCQVLPRGVRLTFGGYNDKLKTFAAYISSKLAQNLDNALPKDEEEFERYKDNLYRALTAFNVKEPYAHAIYYSSLTMQPRNFVYSNQQLVAALKETTLSQLAEYVKTLWGSGKGEALLQGNINKRKALDIVATIDKTLAFKTVKSEQYPKRLKALPLPTCGSNRTLTRLSISEPNPSNKNAASQITLQCLKTSEKAHVLIEVISAIIEQPLFDELRTKQQLGYIVSSGVKGVDQSRFFSTIVQSNVAPAEKLTLCMVKFLDSVRDKLLLPLSSIDIELYVKSLVDKRLEPDKQLAVEVTRNWSEISNGRLQFDRLQAEVAAILDISKDDIIEFWDELYLSESSRILVTEVVPRTGQASSKEPALDGNAETRLFGINDIDQLRAAGESSTA